MQKSKQTSSDPDLNPVGNCFINLRSGKNILKREIITSSKRNKKQQVRSRQIITSATNEKVSTTYISDDIAFSILSKLPLKSFKRFQCVRKSWSLLSENTHFMNMFRNNLLSNSYYDGASILVHHRTFLDDVFYSLSGERFENKFKLDFSNSFTKYLNCYDIVFGFGSINGTLCLHQYEYVCGEIVLWNPTTQTIKLLPPSPVQSIVESFIPDFAKEFKSLIVFYYLHGFGYDDFINDYKVIRYVTVNSDSVYLDGLGDNSLALFWEIYSLRSNSWRKLDVDMPASLDCEAGTQVYMDGVCHWLCEAGECVVSFYLSNEIFFVTPIPSGEDVCFEFGAWINLVVLNGSVVLISYHKETTTFYISILGELGVEESWTKLFIVGPLSCVERPLGVGMSGEIFFIRKDKELVWLDLKTQMIEEVGFKDVNSIDRIIIYKEIFVQLEE